MNDIHIILHCLPREIDDLERIVNQLKISSHYLEKNDKVVLDFTLNLSDYYTDWSASKLPKDFFVEKYKVMESKSDWTHKNIFDIEISKNKCLGINDKRRISIYDGLDFDYLMYLDVSVQM